MPRLITPEQAERLKALFGFCSVCGKPATCSQRPAIPNGMVIGIGDNAGAMVATFEPGTPVKYCAQCAPKEKEKVK